MRVLTDQRGTHIILIDLDHRGAGLCVLFESTVVEDRYDAVGVMAGIMLPVRSAPESHGEVATFPAQTPGDLARLARDLVQGGSPARRDGQVSVGMWIYGVDVEVIESRLEVGRWTVERLLQLDMVEAVPLEEHLPALDVDLLDNPFQHRTVDGAAHTGQVRTHFIVDRDQRRILGRDNELVVIPFVAVAGPDSIYLPVGMVTDHILALSVACVVSLPPGEYRLPSVRLDCEVEGVGLGILQGMEPDRLSTGVDYKRRVLGGGLLLRTFLRRDEDVAWRGAGHFRAHLDVGRAKVGARTERPRLALSLRRGGHPRAGGRTATKGAGECDQDTSGSYGPEKPSAGDPCPESPATRPFFQSRPLSSFLASGLGLGPEKRVVVVGEEVLVAIALEDVVHVFGIGGFQRSPDRLAARAADGSRRQSLSLVGIVRRVDLQVGEREVSLGPLQCVLDRRVDLERHALAHAIVDNRGYQRLLLGGGGFLLDKGGDGHDLVLLEVETLLRFSYLEILGLDQILAEEPVDYLPGVDTLLEIVSGGKEVPFRGLDATVFEERVSVVGFSRRLLELRGGDAGVPGDDTGRLLDSQTFGYRDHGRGDGLPGGQFLQDLHTVLACFEGVASRLYLRSVSFIPGLQFEDEGTLYDPGRFQFGGDIRESIPLDHLDSGRSVGRGLALGGRRVD